MYSVLPSIERCLVQVSRRSWSGRIKHCYVHDILHELATLKAKESNLILVPSQSQLNASSTPETHARTRRLALLNVFGIEELPIRLLWPYLRSLVCFGDEAPNWSGIRMLRVLHFQGGEFYRDPKWLKHLSNLGYFYCDHLHIAELPTSFWNNRMLRYFKSEDFGVGGPESSANLENLVTLKGVELIPEWTVKLPHFPLLRKLRIWVLDGIDWEAATNSLSKLEHLCSLHVRAPKELSHPFFTPAFQNYNKLLSLYLDCRWPGRRVGDHGLFPRNLAKLTLQECYLEQDPMPELEKLPCLRVLRLQWWSYEGEQLRCCAGGFRRLQHLQLEGLDELKELKVEEGAMPLLAGLQIESCRVMRMLPDLHFLTNLRELKLDGMPRKLCSRLEGADQHKVQHITSIIMENIRYG